MPQERIIDLNCDLGEGGPDASLLPLCGRVNIATGGHAGDEASMRGAIDLARRHGVIVGAHPSYPDRDGFGRRELHLGVDAIAASVRAQLASFLALAADAGVRVAHLKPHGALYHRAGHDEAVARAVVAIAREAGLAIVGHPGSVLARACADAGQPFLGEFFADRRYEADGTLTPRSRPDAVIEDAEAAVAQVQAMIRERVVLARTGERVAVGTIDTVCVHGDGATAIALLRRLREALADDCLGVTAE